LEAEKIEETIEKILDSCTRSINTIAKKVVETFKEELNQDIDKESLAEDIYEAIGSAIEDNVILENWAIDEYYYENPYSYYCNYTPKTVYREKKTKKISVKVIDLNSEIKVDENEKDKE